MNVMVFEGYLGSGKTLGMSLFAYHFKRMSNCVLYSNYGVVGSKSFTSIENFKDIVQEKSTILCLDEAHIDLDARSFSSNSVKFFSQVSYYLRKLRCTLFIASPSFEDLDSRIRGITNVLVKVSNDKNYYYYTMYDIQSKRFLKRMRIRKQKAYRIGSQIYDTEAMVSPVKVPEKRQDFMEFLEALKSTAEEYGRQYKHSA
ncbi:hypothetical protein [Bacillus cereus]|uniref:hypothetical protein n=1 Tax=Bacillus cereus TaxID=1396 RepID=UPI000BFA3714|nr:hypothetical protein [Bacillus cereus]PFD63265.1 hypothetical protein CN301_30845 [Bacillus cereus]